MNILLPTISPETMKKYPLYVLVTFLGVVAGYSMNSNSKAQRETIHILVIENKRLREENDSLVRTNSDFKDALLIQNGIIKDYRAVVKKTDSLTKKTLKKPAIELLKLNK